MDRDCVIQLLIYTDRDFDLTYEHNYGGGLDTGVKYVFYFYYSCMNGYSTPYYIHKLHS